MRKYLIFPLLLFLVIAALPTLTRFAPLEKLVNRQFEKKQLDSLHISNIQLSWLSSQKIKDFYCSADNLELNIETVRINRSILSILKQKHITPEFLNITLENVQVKEAGKPIYTFEKALFNPKDLSIVLSSNIQQNGQDSIARVVYYLGKTNLTHLFLKNFPTETLNKLAPNLPISSALGDRVNLTASYCEINRERFVEVHVNGTNGEFTTAGRLQDGLFNMTMPLVGSFYLNEHLIPEIEAKPTSKNPIYVYINPEGTQIPIIRNASRQLQIPQMTLDLGKVQCQNAVALNGLLSLLQLQVRFDPSVELWFQEMPLSVINGTCHINRTELLVDGEYQVATWGSVDLNTKSLDLNIGLTDNFLTHAIGIKDLPKGYTIPIQIHGALGSTSYSISDALVLLGQLAIAKRTHLMPILSFPDTPKARPPYPWHPHKTEAILS